MNANGMYNDAALRPGLYQSGFDPRQFLRLNTNEEGRREWSLDTAFKKLWFRTIYPNGRICTTVLEKDERHICINARVYADRMDPPDSYLAEGKAERFAPGDPASAKPYELYFADWAETVAIGRALTNAGFDVPFVNVLQDGLLLDPFTGEVLEENGGPAAAPTPAPQPAAAQTAPPRQYSSVTSPPVQQATQAVISGQQTPAQRQQTSQKLGMTVQQPGASAPQQGAKLPVQEPRNLEEAMQMPLEWAKNYRITVGIHTGKTLSEVAMIAPGALDWYLKKYSGNDFKLRAAVLILDCPFCLGKNGQPDRHGHMEIDLARDRYRCHRCGRMGGKLDLYMAGHPNVLDTRQAYREMMEYLEGPRKGPSRFTPQVIPLPPSLETGKRASLRQLDETYSALLEMLTLTSTHRQNLRDRGLEDGEIDRLAYRSVPAVGQRRLAAELLKRGCTLEGVPGFYLDERERWTLYTWRSGIIMPERDSAGRILGLQVRKDQAEKHKCYWITGAKQKLGAPHACGLHFARPQAACQTGAAYLTEGIMKADIAAWFSHRCFLAVPGVSHYSAVRNALPACRELGIHTVLMAFDMDMYENPAVANCFQTIRGILLEEGFQVKQITWDRAFKGIDDYLKGQIIRPN